MAGHSKKAQYEQQIQNEVNNLLRTGMDNRALSFVSITKVELAADFANAILFWDTFNPTQRGDIKIALDNSLGKIRSHLAKTLQIRHTPSLTARYDSQYEDAQVIEDILKSEKDKGRNF